jgi:threonine dehydrogenase-like Zn-dependent dehydrogenase
MSTLATALVQTGPRTVELREFPLPTLAPGAALVRVEANGVCGSDIDAFEGRDRLPMPAGRPRYPRITGHEIVGIVEELTPQRAARDGLSVGDRVGLNPFLACGACRACLSGAAQMCTGSEGVPSVHGYLPTWREPALWGGYATHCYVSPQTILYRFPATVDPLTATLWNPLAGAIQWAVLTPGTTIGTSVGVLGCGQRGLAAVAAVRLAGAGPVLTTGLAADRHKLDLAREFGADVAVDVEHDDPVAAARQLTGNRGLDLVVDTTPHSTRPVLDALDMLRPGGTLVVAGIKATSVDFPIASLVARNQRLIGVNGQGDEAYRRAAELIAARPVPFERLRTHVFGLDRFEEALDTLTGKVPDAKAINVVVVPTVPGVP